MFQQEKEQLIIQQKEEIEVRKTEKWSNVVIVVSAPEDTAHANDDELVDALQSKYDTLKEKLIYEALERKMGTEEWNKLSEDEKYEKMMEIQMKIKTLQEQGKLNPYFHTEEFCERAVFSLFKLNEVAAEWLFVSSSKISSR